MQLSTATINSVLIHRQALRQHKHLWAPMISIHSSQTVKDALTIMKNHDITALPIYSYQSSDTSQKLKAYHGILSIYDILSTIVFQPFLRDLESTERFDQSRDDQECMKIIHDKQKFGSTAISEIYPMQETMQSQKMLSIHDSLGDLFTRLSCYHRALVCDPVDPTHVTMITQSDLLAFVLSQSSYKQKLATCKVLNASQQAIDFKNIAGIENDPNQPSQVPKHVITTNHKMKALAAFRMMYLHRVTAIALVNEAHEIVASLSASDLRGLSIDRLHDLLLPAEEYIYVSKKITGHEKDKELLLEPMTAKKNEMLLPVIETALLERMHRVWVVDEKRYPIGVVSYSDVFSMLMNVEI